MIWSIDGKIKCITQTQGEDDTPISIDTPYDLTKVGWHPSEVKQFINENMLKKHDWNKDTDPRNPDVVYYKQQLEAKHRETNTLPFSCSECWNKDIQQDTQIKFNFRINFRFILSKFRYYPSVYYIIDFLKVIIAHLCQVEILRNLKHIFPQIT